MSWTTETKTCGVLPAQAPWYILSDPDRMPIDPRFAVALQQYPAETSSLALQVMLRLLLCQSAWKNGLDLQCSL